MNLKAKYGSLLAIFLFPIAFGAGPAETKDRFQEASGAIMAQNNAEALQLGIGDIATINVDMPASIEGRRVAVLITGVAEEHDGKDTIRYHLTYRYTVKTMARKHDDYWPIVVFVPETSPNNASPLQIKSDRRRFVAGVNGAIRGAQIFTVGTAPNTNVFFGPSMRISKNELTEDEISQLNGVINDLQAGRLDVEVDGGGIKRLQWTHVTVQSYELQRGGGIDELVQSSSTRFYRESIYRK